MRALWICLFAASNCLAQQGKSNKVLSAPVDQSTAVNFFWFGDMAAHYRVPITFRIAAAGRQALHTVQWPKAPLSGDGATLYITPEEMRRIIEQLANIDVEYSDWQHSNAKVLPRIGPLGQMKHRADIDDTAMTVTVVSATGTLRAKIRVTRLCDELASFDPLMPTALLRWQFQTYRNDFGCITPGYDNFAPPHS